MDVPGRSPFDPPLDEMQAIGAAAVDFASRFIDERYTAATSDYDGLESVLTDLAQPPPRDGVPLPRLLALLDTAATKGFDTANPGFVGYIPGGGLYAAAIGDFLACVVNRYTGVAQPAPALVRLEATVLRWLCDLFGLPPAAQGVLTPGGSMSTLSAIVAARTTRLGEDFGSAALYVSDEVHHSVAKAAKIAGLPAAAVRVVATDAGLRMDPDALRAAVANDRRRGDRPFLVVGSAGTINAGMVDPLDAIADVAEQEGLWYHVDAAYGGFFQLTQRGKTAFRGIERADTITLDPHKGMFLPYGTGCLLARDGQALRRSHEVGADYLPRPYDDPALPDFSSYSPELTRDFRGLRLWLPLYLHGVDAFVRALDEKLDLAATVYQQLRTLPRLEVPWPPDLSLVAFRPRDGGDEQAERLLAAIHASGRVWLSTAEIRGRTHLRICILSHRSRSDRMAELVDVIRAAVEVQ
ncbi:MAG TPA: pyridoxal-dependent decarboxylase [Actinomycetes bacterium]|nr:pyridoxal-dependent decarboxylase [Actinomycetes bacterium]